MKFKIIQVILGTDLKVVISTDECGREVFSLPVELSTNNAYIDEIKRVLSERETKEVGNFSIDPTVVGKEFE